ncbi:NAD-dependent epimerase/dehydratase family protein [Microlunatus speluncae]|uniref:NAD-dependent epimerase/dehydratase family protein n=1 Tax=Microlunatus speluncae TaxID=2594267 RepID=UPI0012666220|nr:NAD-dependent epimerase/dehydratase family protein [Microlunatus speluncae]
MRVVVIGGTGHIGTFLVPGLVRAGHEVAVISRGRRSPYAVDDAWGSVTMITGDREQEDQDGIFGDRIAGLEPEAVIDHTCFTVDSARQLAEALVPGTQLIHTGSIWSYGRNLVVPVLESSPKAPFGEYGINKARIEDYLLRDQDRVRATVIHPGHISGPGWVPINPAGNLELSVYADLITSGRAVLPERGTGLLQHVHAADVADLHRAALDQPGRATGEAFNSVATESMTLRGYAELVATEYGHPLDLELLPWAEFVARVGEDAARPTADHIEHSPHASAAKAERVLGFRPAHTGWETVREAIAWLIRDGRLPQPS